MGHVFSGTRAPLATSLTNTIMGSSTMQKEAPHFTLSVGCTTMSIAEPVMQQHGVSHLMMGRSKSINAFKQTAVA